MEDTVMKKVYLNPTMDVIKINTQQMLAASPASFDDLGSGEVNLSSDALDPGDPSDEVLSRWTDFDNF